MKCGFQMGSQIARRYEAPLVCRQRHPLNQMQQLPGKSSILGATKLQSGAAYHSLGFEDENLGSSQGWWANCSYLLPKQTGETTQIFIFKT